MFKNIHRLLTILSFFFPLLVYVLTMAPTTSFWDCGEFISTSYILGVPHPPGSPFYLLLGNVFSSIPFFSDIGARVNLISPITSAFSVMFLYLIIVYLIEEFYGRIKNFSDCLVVYASSIIAALTFAFTDAQWFNAVEAEVYSLSTFFTSIVVWMILKWNKTGDTDWNIRYLLIIIYMFGLAIGVHLLNLLTLPFVALIIYFKRFEFSIKTFLFTMGLTLAVFLTIYIGIIKGIPDITSKLGSLNFLFIMIIGIIGSIILIHLISKKPQLNIYATTISIISSISILFLIVSSLFIKDKNKISLHNQNELINVQKKIDNYDREIYKLNNSVNEDQLYLDKSLQQKINNKINERNNLVEDFRKHYETYINFEENKNKLSFISIIKWQPKWNLLICIIIFTLATYFLIKHGQTKSLNIGYIYKFFFLSILLIIIGYSSYTMIFIRAGQNPAINENNPNNIDRALAYMNRDQYGDWEILNWSSTIARPENTNWKRYTLNKNNPSFREQLNFFINYQINEMYLRYFAWQFAGKGNKDEYPWYIKNLNGNLIGNQQLDGINWFRYGLPLALLLGLLGLYAHFTKDWKRAFSVLSLFLTTGLMIIIYLNQYDPQPRERDYSYVGSFFAFSIWIGIGLSYILNKIKNSFENKNIANFISIPMIVLIFIGMPINMLATDYNEHDRSKNYVAWDYGYNLLNSCEENGILFTNGDNDTFPLWYLQEVEGIRKDVKVVNLSLLNTGWYIEQLMNQKPKLNFNFKQKDFKNNIYNIEPYSATEASFKLCSQPYDGESWTSLDCNMTIKDQEINFNLTPTLIGKLLRVQDYMILKIIQDIGKSKPIYFAATVSELNQIGLQKYLSMEGMTYRLNFSENVPRVNYNKMKQNLLEANNNKIIYTSDDYKNAIIDNQGLYRYTNLNDTTVFYSGNIQRLVQNYRIGFIRLAQQELLLNKNKGKKNAEEFIDLMNQYFPENKLPIEPGIALLVTDSVYAKTGNVEKQKLIYDKLFKRNLPIETSIYLFHKFSEIHETNEIIKKADELIYTYHKQFDFELEKYFGDILSDYIGQEKFIEYCNNLLDDYPLKGMLYSLVRVYEEVGQREEAMKIVRNWLNQEPENEYLIRLYNYLIEINSFQ